MSFWRINQSTTGRSRTVLVVNTDKAEERKKTPSDWLSQFEIYHVGEIGTRQDVSGPGSSRRRLSELKRTAQFQLHNLSLSQKLDFKNLFF